MTRVLFWALAGLILGATGLQALTPSANDSTVYQLPDSILVTANRFGLPAEKSIWPGKIVSRPQLELSSSLDQAVDGAGGSDIRNYSGLGSLATLSSWGALARHMLLLYDGRPVRDYSLGGFNLAEFSQDEFSRVEFLKGPQSAFYGSDAVAGVINLVTPSTLVDRLDVATRVGSFDTRQYRIDVARNLGTMGIGGFGEYASSDNRRANSGAERTVAGVRSDILSSNGRRMLRVSGRFLDDSLGVPGPVPDPAMVPDVGNAESSSLYDHQTDRKYAVDAQYRYHPSPSVTAQVDGFWERKDVSYFSKFSLESVTRSTTRHRSSGLTARILKTLGAHSVSSGIDFLSGSVRENSFDSSSFGVSSNEWAKRQDQVDFWGASTIAADRRVAFDISGRLQFVKGRKSQPSYDLGSVLKLNDAFSLKLAYGYAFRLPSIADQYVVGPYTQGNPNLKPETSRALAATLSFARAKNGVHVDATVFHRTVESLVQYQFEPSTYKYVPVNVDRMRSTGVDVSAECSLTKFVSLNWSSVWQSARQSYGPELAMIPSFYIPRLKWRLNVASHMLTWLTPQVNVMYTGARSIRMSDETKLIRSVYEIGGSVSATLSKHVDVIVMVADLTDERRPDQFGFSLTDGDYPSIGRTVTVRTAAHLF